MFRPNRIGTPVVHTNAATVSTADMTLLEKSFSDDEIPVNILNAANLLDFGRYRFSWTGTEAVASANKIGLGVQFTVTTPLAGNVRGVEIIGSLQTVWPLKGVIIPTMGRLPQSQTIMAGVAYDGGASFFGQPSPYEDIAVATVRSITFKETFIIQGTPTGLPGTYAAGFTLFNNSGSSHNLIWIDLNIAVRQLNDQQNVGYADTLR